MKKRTKLMLALGCTAVALGSLFTLQSTKKGKDNYLSPEPVCEVTGGGTSITMEYNPSNSDAVTKSWRYTFNNRTTSQNIAIRLDAEPSLTNMSIKYGYDTEKLDNANNADKKTDKYEAQMLTPGQSINVYIIASVTDSSKVASYVDKINWRIGEGATTTIVNQDGTETTDHVIKGMPVNEALPVIQPSVADCEFEGWYLDEDLTIPVTNMSQTNGVKVYPRVPNLPADWLTLSGNEYKVKKGNSALPANLVIPSTYNGKPVTSIVNGNSRQRVITDTSINTIVMPDSITSIGDYAINCTNATKIVFGEDSQLTTVGNYAFYVCAALTSITIPASVTNIGTNAFCNCSALTSITIPASVTNIGINAFYNCNDLTTVTFDSNSKLTSIDGVFWNCPALTSITIPASVTNVGTKAFFNCNVLTSITIPASVTTISQYAFIMCENLENITFEDTEGWYKTASEDYQNGEVVDVSNSEQNAEWFKSSTDNEYTDYYWYKEEVAG